MCCRFPAITWRWWRGSCFFLFAPALRCVPSLASRYPIKKWAAIGALVAATFYLLLSGAEVATQRSYIMIAIVLMGVMLDRPTLTFRTFAVAAIGVLMFAPQAVVHPSFQMSLPQRWRSLRRINTGLPWRADADSSLGARVALWGVREFAGLILASLVAGLATTPYAAFHFHRLAPYGVVANLLAMPVVSALVMPMGILGLVAMPFGFDAPFWRLMGGGIDWMIWVAYGSPACPAPSGACTRSAPARCCLGRQVCCCLSAAYATAVERSGDWALSQPVGVVTPQPDIWWPVTARPPLSWHRRPAGVLHSGRDTFAVQGMAGRRRRCAKAETIQVWPMA